MVVCCITFKESKKRLCFHFILSYFFKNSEIVTKSKRSPIFLNPKSTRSVSRILVLRDYSCHRSNFVAILPKNFNTSKGKEEFERKRKTLEL